MALSDGLELLGKTVAAGQRQAKPRLMPRWAVVESLSPLRVVLADDPNATPLGVATNAAGSLQVGWMVLVQIAGGRLAVLSAPAQVAGMVPWSIPGRRIVVGPDGDQEPSVVIKRDRPNYSGTAYMYLAGSVNSTEFAVAVQDGGVTQATLRLDRDNIRHQDAVGGRGTRYVAFRDELPAAPRLARGLADVTVSASAGGTANVTFPAGRFTSSDYLDVHVDKYGANLAKFIPYHTNLTPTGMTIGIYSGDGTTATGTLPLRWRVEAI